MTIIDNHRTNSLFVEFVSGGIASGTSVAPFDRIKILYQTKNIHYIDKSIIYTINNIIKNEGFVNLWKGNFTTIIRYFPYSSIQFMIYEQGKILLDVESCDKKIKPIINFISGASAGAISAGFTYPMDLLRVQQAINMDKDPGHKIKLYTLIKNIYTNYGIGGFYRGIIPTLQGILPYVGTNFCTYEIFKYHFQQHNALNMYTILLSGTTSGLIGQIVSYPFDVVRRRLQSQSIDANTKIIKYSTCKHIYVIIKNEGVKNLYKGIGINFIRAGPSMGVGFVTYEHTKKFLTDIALKEY